MMKRIIHGPKAVVPVQGTATAAGCQLVSACDMAGTPVIPFLYAGRNLGAFCTTPL